MEFKLLGERLSIYFSFYKYIFKEIYIKLENSNFIGLIGPNGSGKTTLLKILFGLIKPTNGSVTLELNNEKISKNDYFKYISLVGPYITLYEEFTALEIIELCSRLRNVRYDNKKAHILLQRFNLEKRKNDYIKTFSSGMKQRLRYILNFYFEPIIMLFDEPYTNLDNFGIQIINEMIEESLLKGCGIIIASNNKEEVNLCSNIIELGKL